MKLYDVPRDTRIVLREDGMELELNFLKMDGMYAHCTTDSGVDVHLAGWVDADIIVDGVTVGAGDAPTSGIKGA